MIEDKYLIEWIKEEYPAMQIENGNDLCELDYYDMEKFSKWLVKQLTPPDNAEQGESCPHCGKCYMNYDTDGSRLNWECKTFP